MVMETNYRIHILKSLILITLFTIANIGYAQNNPNSIRQLGHWDSDSNALSKHVIYPIAIKRDNYFNISKVYKKRTPPHQTTGGFPFRKGEGWSGLRKTIGLLLPG